MNWKYFCGACLLGGALVLKAGAPYLSVFAGIALATIMKLLKDREGRTL